MNNTNQTENKQKAPNFEALGFKSPMEIIDLLALLKIDGEPIIKDEQIVLDPKLKAQAVMEFFLKNYNVPPNDLPYLAALVKKEIKNKQMTTRKT
jgi:hypothetical protein